jgi:hypothetical protein
MPFSFFLCPLFPHVRKNAAHKESSGEVSCPRAKFNGRLEPPG